MPSSLSLPTRPPQRDPFPHAPPLVVPATFAVFRGSQVTPATMVVDRSGTNRMPWASLARVSPTVQVAGGVAAIMGAAAVMWSYRRTVGMFLCVGCFSGLPCGSVSVTWRRWLGPHWTIPVTPAAEADQSFGGLSGVYQQRARVLFILPYPLEWSARLPASAGGGVVAVHAADGYCVCVCWWSLYGASLRPDFPSPLSRCPSPDPSLSRSTRRPPDTPCRRHNAAHCQCRVAGCPSQDGPIEGARGRGSGGGQPHPPCGKAEAVRRTLLVSCRRMDGVYRSAMHAPRLQC